MKFKVGDRVRFVESIIYHTKAVKLGGIYTVKTIDNKNKQYLVSCENKHGEFFEEEELALAEYKYEDLKKASIGTKITFEKGNVLVRTGKNKFENETDISRISELINIKDRYYGKIVKIEEPTYSTVYEYKPEILDKAEKRYLRGVIGPFRESVKEIRRMYSLTKEKDYIQIRYKNESPTNLPYFEKDTMYSKMEVCKGYTLKELGL